MDQTDAVGAQGDGQSDGQSDGQTLAASEAAGEASGQPNFVAFRVMGQDYCLDILAVREISQRIHITPLPKSPAFISGVINLRGSVVPVLDCQVRFGLKPQASPDRNLARAPAPAQAQAQAQDQAQDQGQGQETTPARQVIIVVQIGTRTLGLLVDEVTEILNIPHNAIKAIPDSDDAATTPLVSGVIVKDARIIRHIDLAQVVPEKELVTA